MRLPLSTRLMSSGSVAVCNRLFLCSLPCCRYLLAANVNKISALEFLFEYCHTFHVRAIYVCTLEFVDENRHKTIEKQRSPVNEA